MSELLKMTNVTCAFEQKRVVDGFSLTVAEGETVCLLGPSGSGKSTSLRLIAGFEHPQSGEISINQKIVENSHGLSIPPEKRGLGYLFQEYALFPHLSLSENIGFGLNALSAQARADRVSALLDAIGLAELQNAYPNSISGGEQQRVALARALAARPKLMLMDEPFSSLDPQLRLEMRHMIKSLLAEEKIGAVIVTHDAEDAMALADRIAVMIAGQIVQLDLPEVIYRQPVNRTVARIFGDFNELPINSAQAIFADLDNVPAQAQAMGVRYSDIWLTASPSIVPASSQKHIQFKAALTPLRDMGSYVECAVQLTDEIVWKANLYGPPPSAGEHMFTICVDRIVFFDDK